MSSQARKSILDDALTCIGNRISTILLRPGDKDENYIISLHNEVLAAVWMFGVLSSGGSSAVPESVRVAFRCFSDIKNPGSYTMPDGSWPPQDIAEPSDTPNFDFTEWWNIGEGETLREPFDVREEVVLRLSQALEVVEAEALLHARVQEKISAAKNLGREIMVDVKKTDRLLQVGIQRLEERLAGRAEK